MENNVLNPQYKDADPYLIYTTQKLEIVISFTPATAGGYFKKPLAGHN
jgi:hypothetical protein